MPISRISERVRRVPPGQCKERVTVSSANLPPKSRRDREAVPPLEAGDRLTRDEFERRYDAMPDLKKAELIEGVVYMPSPVRLRRHGNPHGPLLAWLFTYEGGTPGLIAGDNGTVRLDMDNTPQPDAFLLFDPICGGQARIRAHDSVELAPESVGE